MKVFPMVPSRLFAFFLCLLPLTVSAHEFWIAPVAYQVEHEQRLQAHFRNGEEFEGTTLSFFAQRSVRFEMHVAGQVTRLTPRSGDSPALDVAPPIRDGLVTVVHESLPSSVTYRDWEKFLKFAAHKDFPQAAADHAAAGWSQVKFRERYSRHVKSLIAVGDGKGRDVDTGMTTEFIALSNPYDADFTQEMKVLLRYLDQPRADAQVEVFDRAPDGAVTISLHRTDAQGQVTVPVTRGHEYLFDAVVLRPAPEAGMAEGATVWETYWAALTFFVP